MTFDNEQLALLDANADRVEAARLFEMVFSSTTIRLAESEIEIETLDGRVWQPGFNWITAAPVEGGDPLEAKPATYTVGEVTDTLITTVLHDRAEWYNAPIRQYMQLYLHHAPVGHPIMMHPGLIRDISYVLADGEQTFVVTAEGLLSARNWSPLGEYTDRDQQSRSPGDRGCEEVASLRDKRPVGWNRA